MVPVCRQEGSWRASEAGHYVAGLESQQRAQERLLVEMESSCGGDLAITMVGAGLSLQDRLCVLICVVAAKTLCSPEDHEWVPDI